MRHKPDKSGTNPGHNPIRQNKHVTKTQDERYEYTDKVKDAEDAGGTVEARSKEEFTRPFAGGGLAPGTSVGSPSEDRNPIRVPPAAPAGTPTWHTWVPVARLFLTILIALVGGVYLVGILRSNVNNNSKQIEEVKIGVNEAKKNVAKLDVRLTRAEETLKDLDGLDKSVASLQSDLSSLRHNANNLAQTVRSERASALKVIEVELAHLEQKLSELSATTHQKPRGEAVPN